jgi:hypothetical protein
MRGIDLADARVNWTTRLCSGPEVLHEVVAPYSADLIWMPLGATAPE